jgi:hypothetical protein
MLSFAASSSAGLRTLNQMMADLAPVSAQSAETIRRVYQGHLSVLTLREYGELTGALDNGGLVPLPDNPQRFNIVPRLDGPHPIGEKDLANQSSYTTARAATIGALLEIASRVKSGPVEITSLVRHGDYQEELRATNPNATTSVPMHTMGLAVDIGLINTPLETIHEIRDVLQRMQEAGDILFIGERRQLVFHVVPQPSRLGYFNDVYLRTVGEPLTSRSAAAVAFLEAPRLMPAQLTPQVTTEIIAMVPTEGPIQNLWIETPRTKAKPVAAAHSRWHPPTGARWLILLVGFASVGLVVLRSVRLLDLRSSSGGGLDLRSFSEGGQAAPITSLTKISTSLGS